MKKHMTIAKKIAAVLVGMSVSLSVNIYGQGPVGTVQTATVYNSKVNFEGTLPDYYTQTLDEVMVLMIEKGADGNDFTKVAYVNEFPVDVDGNYRCLFRFDGNPSDYDLKVRFANYDVTNTLTTEAGAVTDMTDVKVYKSKDGSFVRFYNDIVNKYVVDRSYAAVFAVYDANGTLYDIATVSDKTISGTGDDYIVEVSCPVDSDFTAKAFLLNNLTDIMPFGKTNVDAAKAEITEAPLGVTYIPGENFNITDSRGFNCSAVGDPTKSGEDYTNAEGDLVDVYVGNHYGAYMTKAEAYLIYKDVDLTNMMSIEMFAGANKDNFKLDILLDGPDGEKIGEYTIASLGVRDVAGYGGANLTKRVSGKHTICIKPSGNGEDALCKIKYIRFCDKQYEQHIAPQYYENDHASISYTGSWSALTNGITVSNDSNASAVFTFSGTGVDINGAIGPDCGWADVYIDGVYDKTLNLYNANSLTRCIYTKANLTPGTHTVEIKNVTASAMYIDSFKVYQSPIRVLCMGDSITQGTGSSNQGFYSWPAQLSELLGDGYVVFNNARHGCTLASWQNEWMKPSALKLDADIIICAIGTNDYIGGWNTFDAATYKSSYAALLKEIAAANSNGVTPRIYVCKPPHQSKDFEAYRPGVSAMFDEISVANNWPVIDFLSRFGGQSAQFADNLHLNDRGLGIMAEIAFESLPCPELVNAEKLDYRINEIKKKDSSFTVSVAE